LLERRNIIASISDGDFADACVQVFVCANNQVELTKKEREKLYTLDTYEQFYQSIAVRSDALNTLEDPNYGDDLFANKKQDDAPYDLLYDIERIGNILYSHNDPATEIQFYDLRPIDSYKQASPLIEKDYETKIPTQTPNNNLAQLPLTNGVTPVVPDLSYKEQLDTRNQSFHPSDSKSAQDRLDQ